MPKCIGCGKYNKMLYQTKNIKYNMELYLCKKCIEKNKQNSEKINGYINDITKGAEKNLEFGLEFEMR